MKTATKKQETLVNFILDKSGSMSSVQASTISAFNEYIGSLKKDGNKYSFSLVLFDTSFTDAYMNVPISEVEDLDTNSYRPDGGTALYDAVCTTIKQVKDKVTKNQKVLTVIMTDGEENSSKEYSQEQLKAQIAELEKTGKWSFVFLGANQNSWASASKMGIPTMNTTNFSSTDAGIKSAMQVLSSNTRAFNMSAATATSAFFSSKDQDSLSGTSGKPSLSSLSSTNGVDPALSAHFSNLGKKSWEARKRDILG